MDETTTDINVDDAQDTRVEPTELVDDELLVEEISIDGMCGVY